jgi:CRISPR-associated endonuclease/helicase Cas3
MVDLPTRLVAHTPAKGSDRWHYLDEHSLAVTGMAAAFAATFGGHWLARVAGLLHDAGKAHPDFQNYLLANVREPDRKHPTVDHKSCGAVHSQVHTGHMLEQVLLGHHGGLPDVGNANAKINARVTEDIEPLTLAWERFSAEPGIAEALGELKERSVPAWVTQDPLELEFLLRMVFSCLVDADALDTERHMNPEQHLARDVAYPTLPELWERLATDQGRFARDAMKPATEVNRVRAEVYDACLEKALLPPGIFRLTVPTGGGKTRSGLAFALRHALAHGQSRVIVAVPFITITDQTAKVYRDALGDDHAVLEHHSGIEPKPGNLEGGEDATERWRKLASQNWDVPLIVTTTVQLFESLFANRTSTCRKLHNVANSVIILDEVQTIPAHLRGPLFEVFRELVRHYGVTIVLSTATQPVLDTIAPQLAADGREIVEIAPDPPRLVRTLERVRYEWPCLDEVWGWERVAEEMSDLDQVLVVVNTIADAAMLFKELDDEDALHLSTRMCQAHRRDVLEEVRRRLAAGEPCRLVSTQLIEAGVDLDFPVVMRAIGPLDRVVQAAGRCNREGRMPELGRVVVFSAETDEKMPPGTYKRGAQETRSLLREPDFDPTDPETFVTYFTLLYGGESDDRPEIQKQRQERNYETVADLFEMIEDDTFPVVVRYGDAKVRNRIIDDLQRSLGRPGAPIRGLMQKVQPYVVNCRRRQQGVYESNGSIEEIVPGLWEWKGGYDEKLGLSDTRLEPEGLFI